MIRIAALLSILLTTSANSECWIVTNLHGYGAMNGDRYEFTKDSTEDSVFHVTINGDKSSVYEGGDYETLGIFAEGRSLFTPQALFHTITLREAETEFGIVRVSLAVDGL